MGPVSAGSSSGQATPTSLKRVLEQEFDSAKESRAQWQSRLLRGVAQLERLGYPMEDREIEKLIIKGNYAEGLGGLDLKGQVRSLKSTFGKCC